MGFGWIVVGGVDGMNLKFIELKKLGGCVLFFCYVIVLFFWCESLID